ncbi:hypothetical protein [Methyloradius palustris]|uniref:Uncharacterized protein n=1 Tax=Methyloradius palustris TaxID=2778876 RepID=A0A8D5GAG6_9PROT|nr:hypothetical protein [Methyloradius palustris]BCM26001.1 hypothetical protein ZMTM_22600 [Methyloradius palustris]
MNIGPTVRRSLFVFVASLLLYGCSKDDEPKLSADISYQEPVSPYEKMLTDLEEQSKAYTFLDRTDTLGGVDVDQNGIRDDIQKFIDQKKYTERERVGITQMAKSIQEIVKLDLKDEAAVHDATINSYKATACLIQVTTDENKAKALMGDKNQGAVSNDKTLLQTAQQLGNMTANTRIRIVNYLAFNDEVDIAYNAADMPMPCDYDHAYIEKLKIDANKSAVTNK